MSQLADVKPGGLGARINRLAWWLALTAASAMAVAFSAVTLVPRVGPFATFAVLTPSMEPSIPMGSLVIVVPSDPADLHEGDVISFTSQQAPYQTLTHRIVSVRPTADGPAFRTRGDANETADPWEVQYSGLGGKVAWFLPAAGYAVVAATNPEGRWILGGILAVLIVITAQMHLFGSGPPSQAAVPTPRRSIVSTLERISPTIGFLLGLVLLSLAARAMGSVLGAHFPDAMSVLDPESAGG